MGFFKVVTGVMGCGKSTRLISDYNSLLYKGCKIAVIKPILDKRDEGIVKSRNISNSIQADYVLGILESIPSTDIIVHKVNYVMVDEAQFLSDEQIQELYKLSAVTNINVVLYGLKMCWKGVPFKSMQLAIGLAEKVEEIESFNNQGEKLTHQVIIKDHKPLPITKDAPEIYIGDVASSDDIKVETIDSTSGDENSKEVVEEADLQFLTVTKKEFYNIYNLPTDKIK